jgi:hypothetical protein
MSLEPDSWCSETTPTPQTATMATIETSEATSSKRLRGLGGRSGMDRPSMRLSAAALPALYMEVSRELWEEELCKPCSQTSFVDGERYCESQR